jgi:hypothetical protein
MPFDYRVDLSHQANGSMESDDNAVIVLDIGCRQYACSKSPP